MTVWVLMGNDWPCGVYRTQALAEINADILRAKDIEKGCTRISLDGSIKSRIYYRSTEFELDESAQ